MKSVQLISNAIRAARSGKLEDAERILRQVALSDPKNVQAWYTLACVLMDMRRPHHAAEVFGQTLRLSPNHCEAMIGLARAQGLLGNLPQALAAAKRATEADPKSAAAWIELACRHRVMMHPNESLSAARRAEALEPGNAEAFALATANLQDLGRHREAAESCRRALTLRRGHQELVLLATSLLALGESQEAMSLFEEAEAKHPGLPETIIGKARTAEALGNKELALAQLDRIIDQPHVPNAAIAQYGMLAAQSPERRPRAIDLARNRLSQPTNNPAATIATWFALGSLLEAEGDYPGAFEAYKRGKQLYPRNYSADLTRRRTGEIIETFSSEAMTRLPKGNGNDERPVFIVGMPRSGTTLLEQIIASHPRAAGVGELDDMTRLVNGAASRLGVREIFPLSFNGITPDVMNQMAAEYSERLTQLAPAKDRVVDKMPHNFIALGAIALMFPRGRLIHSKRNPIDTCLSCFTTALGPAHGYATSLENLVTSYREYRRLMDHWKSVLGDRLAEMEYEKLVAEPEPESRRLIAAAGLDWDPACLRFYEGKRAITTASLSQVRRPMYDSSIGRWKRFEPFIGELIEGLREFL